MCCLLHPLFRKHRISIQTKINMYRALVVSDRRRLDVFDMRCQRRLLRVFWQQNVSNQSIRECTKQPTATSLQRKRCPHWFGHLLRMPSSLHVRRVFDFNPNIHGWKRPRGRPETRWDIPSSTTSILPASPPPRPLLADCQRWNPSKALKSSKSRCSGVESNATSCNYCYVLLCCKLKGNTHETKLHTCK